MACTCVVGLQWGDEAKGKIVDLLTDGARLRRPLQRRRQRRPHRRQRRPDLQALAAADRRPRPDAATSVIGNGVVVYPPRFLEEVDALRASRRHRSATTCSSATTPTSSSPTTWRRRSSASRPPATAIGTTGRGIGPCYQDKVGRASGIRVGELLDAAAARTARRHRAAQERGCCAASRRQTRSRRRCMSTLCSTSTSQHGEQLRPHVTDTAHLSCSEMLREGKRILFEAAQGSLLDVDHGTYPYVTSSNSSTAGVWSGSGVPARQARPRSSASSRRTPRASAAGRSRPS